MLFREAQNQRIQKARKTYEKMVEKFPTCGKFWKQYIEHEMKNGNYENVEKLFKRCLVSGTVHKRDCFSLKYSRFVSFPRWSLENVVNYHKAGV